MGKAFYAVQKGFKTGVFHSWDDCKAQVEKFKGATFKKFSSLKDAERFVVEGHGCAGLVPTAETPVTNTPVAPSASTALPTFPPVPPAHVAPAPPAPVAQVPLETRVAHLEQMVGALHATVLELLARQEQPVADVPAPSSPTFTPSDDEFAL